MERGDPGDDEREGLLAGSHGPTTQPPPERARERPEVAAEAVELLCLGVPVSCTSLCRILVFATDAAFVGRLGTTQMAAAALAQVCQSMSYVMIYGTAVALNTLCASHRLRQRAPGGIVAAAVARGAGGAIAAGDLGLLAHGDGAADGDGRRVLPRRCGQ